MNHKSISKSRIQLEGYLFILPIFLFFFIFCVYPIFFNMYYGFFDWNGMSADKTFVGLENYAKLFSDPIMEKIIRNFLLFFLFTIFPQAIFGIVLAYILNRKVMATGFFRTLLYLPSILTVSITGTIFSKILETNQGDLNVLLKSVGLGILAREWLARPQEAMFSLILVNIWAWTGFSMLLYYVNMTHIPEELYESATIDGANSFQQFFSITFPLLRNTHLSLILLGTISTLKTFDMPYVLTRSGPNHATEFFSTYIYTLSFSFFDQGRSSALVVLVFLIALLLTIIQLRMYGVGKQRGGG